MINLIGILSLIIILSIFIMSVIAFFIHKVHLSDNEVAERDKELGLRTETIRNKNLMIRKLCQRIEELENEIKQLKRKNNKRL